jgi:hypothetical protein
MGIRNKRLLQSTMIPYKGTDSPEDLTRETQFFFAGRTCRNSAGSRTSDEWRGSYSEAASEARPHRIRQLLSQDEGSFN